MPELPEVEAARQQLAKAAEGKVIARLRLLHPALAKRITPARLRRLKGRRIDQVERRGKHQLLHLDDGRTLAIHFRMNGDWNIGTVGEEEPRFTRASLELADGTRVALTDMRALSTV
jgi:formamidopyrimidine-DNA glycosylase